MISLLLTGCLSACGPSISAPFVVNLTLDQAARTELSRSGEQVKLIADYYWRPNVGGPSHEDSEIGYVLGGYPMGQEIHEVAGDAPVRFSGRARPSAGVVAGGGDARVLVNVVSARRTHPDNILECGVFDDTLKVATVKGVDIRCSLLP